jgi:hypothetical protein
MNFSDYPFIRLISFSAFRSLGRIPRFPNDADCTIRLSELTTEEYNKSLIVFVSHCWLRGWRGAEGWDESTCPQPDTVDGGKYKLCVKGIDTILKSMTSGIENCYLWIDFGCLDQDGNPAEDLKKMLYKIVQVCDCLFTPIYEIEHSIWEFPSANDNLYDRYVSPAWQGTPRSYLNRAWCRMEMLYATNVPLLEDGAERQHKLKAGLAYHKSQGRRPHLLFGSKELEETRTPIILSPLQNLYFNKYNPIDGAVSIEEDKEIIKGLVLELEPYLKFVDVGYKGEFWEGKMHGIGKYSYDNGNLYEGEWRDDKRHGQGKFITATGGLYEGEWKDDMMHGPGKLAYPNGNVYEGEWKDDKRYGHGKFIFSDGSLYEGAWKNDKWHGRGRFTATSGNVYEGGWKGGKKHGKGNWTFAGGNLYEGRWKDGKRHGQGKSTSTNGILYEGGWKDGKRHGQGKSTSTNGILYEGGWKDGKRHGPGKLSTPKGVLYEGEWKDNKKHGQGKCTFATGRMYEGGWKDGKRHGPGKLSTPEGELYEGQWKDDRLHGRGKFTFASGRLYEVEWEGGSLVEGNIKMFMVDDLR